MIVQSLTDKYRPKKLKEVVGQETSTTRLENIIASKKIPRGLLFTGPTGTGKTTLAYVFARALNVSEQDIIEYDSGVYSKVEDMRNLLEKSRYKALGSEHRVVIIEEAQKLSASAADALLRTLEQMTDTIFILCSMEPEKLKPALISRCSHFQLTPVNDKAIAIRLISIVKKEKFTFADKKLVKQIARNANGSVRSAVAQLEAVAQYVEGADKADVKELIQDAIENIVGDSDYDLAADFLIALYKKDLAKAHKCTLQVDNLFAVLTAMATLNLHYLSVSLSVGTNARWSVLKDFESRAAKYSDNVKLVTAIQTAIGNAKQELVSTPTEKATLLIKHLYGILLNENL